MMALSWPLYNIYMTRLQYSIKAVAGQNFSLICFTRMWYKLEY